MTAAGSATTWSAQCPPNQSHVPATVTATSSQRSGHGTAAVGCGRVTGPGYDIAGAVICLAGVAVIMVLGAAVQPPAGARARHLGCRPQPHRSRLMTAVTLTTIGVSRT